MSDVEGKILKMYDRSKPEDEDLTDTRYVIPWVWGLVAVLFGMVCWFGIALVNAENQRYALMTKQCADPLFKGEVDRQCLKLVNSRPHWWQHLGYGLSHLSPEGPELPPRYKRR